MGRINLHVALFGPIAILVCLALAIGSLNARSSLRQHAAESLEWRSRALAEQAAAEIAAFLADGSFSQEEAQALVERCERAYAEHAERGIVHVAFLEADGRIAAHSDADAVDTVFENPLLLEQVEAQARTTLRDGDTYHTLVPVAAAPGAPAPGSVDVGFSRPAVLAAGAFPWAHFLGMAVALLALTAITTWGVVRGLVIRPLRDLTALSRELAEGRTTPQRRVDAMPGTEMTDLQTSLHGVADYLRTLNEAALLLARGQLSVPIPAQSPHDDLGQTLQKIQRYLSEAADLATHLSTGDLRETPPTPPQDDEFGQALQSMHTGLRDLVAAVQDSVKAMTETGMTIFDLTEQNIQLAERVHTVTENMMSTMQAMGGSVENVARNMNSLSESVQDTSDSVLMITASITHIAGNASDLTKGSHQTIEAMEGSMESLEDVVRSTDISEQLSQETIQDALAGQEAFEHVMRSMEQIDTTITTSVEVITQFERRSQDIDTILDVIREITEQTGLLALNASIIAAQAGDHGKSFGVVAEEIKELAQGVGDSTKDIASILNTLQKDTRKVVSTIHRGAESVREGTRRMEEAQHTLSKIIQSARRSSNVVSEIAEALRKVMDTSRDVVTAMEEVNAMTDDFTVATNEQEMSTEQINNAVTQINTMASQIRQVTDTQLTGVRQMLEAANDVTALIDRNLDSSRQMADITELLASQADRLVQSINRFKLQSETRIMPPDVVHTGETHA